MRRFALILVHCLRRRPSIKKTLGQCLVFSGYILHVHEPGTALTTSGVSRIALSACRKVIETNIILRQSVQKSSSSPDGIFK